MRQTSALHSYLELGFLEKDSVLRIPQTHSLRYSPIAFKKRQILSAILRLSSWRRERQDHTTAEDGQIEGSLTLPRLYSLPNRTSSIIFWKGLRVKLSDWQRNRVKIPDLSEVSDYLVRFPRLIPVVNKVVRLAAKMLPEAQLSLEVYRDPEIDDRYLVLYARFSSYDERTWRRIEHVTNEYTPLLRNTPGWLVLTTDFRPPE